MLRCRRALTGRRPLSTTILSPASSPRVRWRLFFEGRSVGVAVACDEQYSRSLWLCVSSSAVKLRRQAPFLFAGGRHVLTLADTFLGPEPSRFCSMRALQDVGSGCMACGPHYLGDATNIMQEAERVLAEHSCAEFHVVGGGPAGTPMLDGYGKAA